MAQDPPIPKQYNADEVLLECFGSVIQGAADGVFVEFDDNEDSIQVVVGTQGEVAVSRIVNPLGIATVRLMQTSDSNDVLSAQQRLTQNGRGLSGFGPFHLADLNGRTIVEGRAIVMKNPKITIDRSAKEREWKILVVKTNRVDGGNTRVT
jgi:hypothetical protein